MSKFEGTNVHNRTKVIHVDGIGKIRTLIIGGSAGGRKYVNLESIAINSVIVIAIPIMNKRLDFNYFLT